MADFKKIYTREELGKEKGLYSRKDYKLLKEGEAYEVWLSDSLYSHYNKKVIEIITEKSCDICHFKYRVLAPDPDLHYDVCEGPLMNMVAFRPINKQASLAL